MLSAGSENAASLIFLDILDCATMVFKSSLLFLLVQQPGLLAGSFSKPQAHGQVVRNPRV